MQSLLATKEIAIACGSGGVGKTSTAAAIAAQVAVREPGKVLVLTVDPAKRLATALGMPRFGNKETRVPPEAFAAAGVQPRGELWAAMLDTKQSWDALVHRHAPDASTEARILGNPLYQNISGKFVQSHDYIAMERLYELHSSGIYDLIVVDTPPTRNAVDFIEAPQRMAEFFRSRLLKMLIVPYRSKMVNLASRPFYQVADRILGSQFLEDIAEFFILFQTMYSGFVQRATAVERLLRDHRTTFLVVSTLEEAPAREADFFVRVLGDKGYNLGGLIFNKTLPPYLLDRSAGERAERLKESNSDLAKQLAEGAEGKDPVVDASPQVLGRVLSEVGENFRNFGIVARREEAQRREMGMSPEVVATAPEFDSDIHDLTGLLELGERVWG